MTFPHVFLYIFICYLFIISVGCDDFLGDYLAFLPFCYFILLFDHFSGRWWLLLAIFIYLSIFFYVAFDYLYSSISISLLCVVALDDFFLQFSTFSSFHSWFFIIFFYFCSEFCFLVQDVSFFFFSIFWFSLTMSSLRELTLK